MYYCVASSEAYRMRNNIAASCFIGLPDGESPSKLLYDFDFITQSDNIEPGVCIRLDEVEDWWELRASCNFDSRPRNIERLVDVTADYVSAGAPGHCLAESLVFAADESLPEDTQKEKCESRNSLNPESSGRNLEKKRPATSGAAPFATLPEGVVERILAMIPFPYLLKVCSLSKAWYNKFPHPTLEVSSGTTGSSLNQKLKTDWSLDRSFSGSFLSVVSSVSSNWSVYCPVILGNEGLIGYDRVHNRWQGLFTNLQQLLGTSLEPWLINSCGPLICGVSQSPNSQYDVFVTNVLTKRWRKLPTHPSTRVPSLLNVLFDGHGSKGYKVFIVTEDPYEGPHDDCTGHDSSHLSWRCISAQVFDSVNGTWTTSLSEVPSATSFAWRSCSVLFNGNIYCLSGDDRNPIDHPLQVWVYNLQKGIWTEIGHPFGELVNTFSGRSVLLDLTRFRLLVCGSKVIVVLALDPAQPYDDRVGSDSLFIYELDPETRIISLKSRGPPKTVLANSEHIASDGANIYFCTLDLLICYPVVVYNVESGHWSCLPPDFMTAGPLTNKRWADFAYQPGLNPFVVP